jgi:hypothetical protein
MQLLNSLSLPCILLTSLVTELDPFAFLSLYILLLFPDLYICCIPSCPLLIYDNPAPSFLIYHVRTAGFHSPNVQLS